VAKLKRRFFPENRRSQNPTDYCSLCKRITESHDGGVGENHPAWIILLPRMNFVDQMSLSATCKTFRRANLNNAEFHLRQFTKKLKRDKNLARYHDNPMSGIHLPSPGWAFYRALIWILEEQTSVSTRSRGRANEMSGSALLSKAQKLGARIAKYGFGRETGCPYFWSPWVNEIYSPDWVIKINARAPWKSVVGELATGKRKFDDWRFLPTRWSHEISPPQICKNFVLLQFFRNLDERQTDTEIHQEHSDEDFLILDLATREQHWVKTRKLSFDIRVHIRDQDVDWSSLSLVFTTVERLHLDRKRGKLGIKCAFVFANLENQLDQNQIMMDSFGEEMLFEAALELDTKTFEVDIVKVHKMEQTESEQYFLYPAPFEIAAVP
jgi:hypothetical protein